MFFVPTGNLVPISRFTLFSFLNMTGHRKKPFSGKAKKAQLQARKARKAARQGISVTRLSECIARLILD